MHENPDHPLFATWRMMHFRCENPKAGGYAYYGGRGIRVCDRWRSFAYFVLDMGAKPTASHTLDRIDPNGNYDPSNCRWSTRSEQNRASAKRKKLSLVDAALLLLSSGWKRKNSR